ncbi:MAG: hypothetical protein PVH17_06050 [Anaerolineae bacterium]|jgi:hypothetical protein
MREQPVFVRIMAPLLVFLALACGPCSILSAELPTPPHPIAVSTEAAGQLEARIRQNIRGESGQQFILRMTDAEVTSLVATELARYDESPVTDPQIWFTKGKIYGTGRLVNVSPIKTDFYVIALARIQDGKVMVEIEEISAGALPIPDSVLDTISQSVNETVDEIQLDVRITVLEILEGEMIVKGIRE